MTWTQPVCDARWEQYTAEQGQPGRAPVRVTFDEPDECCYCGGPATIFIRVDPQTVPRPRSE